ncbi:MAG: DUF4349 domain-containing protein [Patescibacteria group bacterium]|nr:DUF4349 domain-containing protein [Patescibacteria group bacterium]
MPTPNTPPPIRPHTLRTVILTIVGTIVVVFTLILLLAWRTSEDSSEGVALQTRNSGGMMGYGVSDSSSISSKAIAPSASPEIAYDMMAPTMPSPMPPIYDGSGATAEEREEIGQKIIRNGYLNLRVDDAEKRLTEAKGLATQFGGFVASSNLQDNAGVKTAYLTIRVPSDKFDSLVDASKKLASLVTSESSNADDVTDQFVDLNARLKAAQAEEAQYLEILKQAKSVEDTLKVTSALSQVRARIEQMQGQLRYLTDKTDYATLNLTLTEDTRIEVPTRTWEPLESIRQSFRGLIIALQALVDLLIGLVFYGIGLLLPVLLILYVIYRLTRWVIGKFKK